MKATQRGRSLSVRLAAAVPEALRLKAGDQIEIPIAETRKLDIARQPSRQDCPKQLRACRGRLPHDFKFDGEEASSR